MSLPFKPTKDCVRLPTGWIGKPPGKPLPDLTDEEIDNALVFILAKGCRIADLPRSQYGRRAAVDAFLRYERQQPANPIAAHQALYEPGQPR